MTTEPSAPHSPAELPLDEPGVASVEEGHILLDGPDGVAVTMTVEAARGTAESLLSAVEEAEKAKNG